MAPNQRRWAPDDERELKKTLYRFMGEVYATKAALYVKVSDAEWSMVGQYGFGRGDALARSFTDDEPMVRMVRAFDQHPRYYNGRAEVGELSDYLEGSATHRLLLVPLVDASGLTGFVDVRDKGGRQPFTDTDVEIARAIGRDLSELIAAAEQVAPAEDEPPEARPDSEPPPAQPQAADDRTEALLDDRGFDEINAAAASTAAHPRVAAVALSLASESSGATVVCQSAGDAPADLESLLSHQLSVMTRAGAPVPRRKAWRTEVRHTAGDTAAAGTAIASAVLAANSGSTLTGSVIAAEPRLAHELVTELAERVAAARDAFKLRLARRGLARRLLQPGDRRYPELVAHSLGVSRLCWSLAKIMELDDEAAEKAALAGLLHDVGMRELDYDRLYMHPTPGPEDRRTYRMHVEVGDRIVRVEGFEEIADAVRHHHERWDGNGYPDRMCADDIPRLARIVHVAEVFDLFTAANSYRPAVSRERALAILQRAAGHQFDPTVVDALARVVA